jgi:FtsP/CotA-like multicopper oxidase with cupredoxin domain
MRANVVVLIACCLAIGLAEETIVSIELYNFSLGDKVYQRYGLFGKGPQWVDSHGFGYVQVKNGHKLHLKYKNHLESAPTIIHAHGQEPHLAEDGVPDVSGPPMQPGKSFEIEYKPKPGTYWLHSHWGDQHELGMSLPLIVQDEFPRHYPDRAEFQAAQDVVLSLDNFCPYSEDVENRNCFDAGSVFDSLHDAWQADKPDFNFTQCEPRGTSGDVFYRHQLVNLRTFGHNIAPSVYCICHVFTVFMMSDNPMVAFLSNAHDAPTEHVTVRLRVINTAGMTSYRVQLFIHDALSGLDTLVKGTVVATDGNWVQPLELDTFWLASAQRLDIMVRVPWDHTVVAKAIAAGSAAMTSQPGQAGLVLVAGHRHVPPRNGTWPVVSPHGAVGYMEDWVMQLQAWTSLSEKATDVLWNLNLTGDNGFMSINTHAWRLRPAVAVYEKNPYPLMVKRGQRACMLFRNFNADMHPMHLHGHHFQIVEWNGTPINGPFRDTVAIPRGECRTVKVCFDADQHDGEWVAHCHLSFHLEAGMLTSVVYT